MSTFSDSLIAEVASTLKEAWDSRDGQVVPETDDLRLANDRVELDAVLLYADLADSTEMAMGDQEIASEVFKSYLRGVTKIIGKNDGEVRSFDGDRVMGVFIGKYKNSAAAKCGLQINWFFNALVRETKAYYGDRVSNFNFDQTVGIDRSSVHVARSGDRDNNDLIWVGRAPYIAAKMSAIRMADYKTFITPSVYDRMHDSSKLVGTNKTNMWTRMIWNAGKTYGLGTIYGSGWTWTP
jgi:adenylate cyclase